jgi:hypothetical protein
MGWALWSETMTLADRRDVDRVLVVVSDLKSTAKTLEILHEIDVKLAMTFFEKAPPLHPTERVDNPGIGA